MSDSKPEDGGSSPHIGAIGKMAEWLIATVLKTVEGNTSGGSNPSLSAKILLN
jgi:hypothetical protein